MADERRLLVVDDEEVVCQACRRIFSRQGFQVETHTDPRQGLVQATENDYAIILLDIKMPYMDGIQFLERLRQKKPDVPVLIITGYPSIPNAAAAMRLGACDYVTKPFTSEEVTWGMQRVLNMQHVLNDEGETVAEERAAVVNAMANIETLFWDESWVQLAVDGSALVGAACRPPRGLDYGRPHAENRRSRLPGAAPGGRQPVRQTVVVIPSPISGVVAEVNALLADRPIIGERSLRRRLDRRHLCDAARGNDKLQAPALLLVNSDPCSADEQTRKLADLGCQVEKAPNADVLFAALAEIGERVVFLDAASLGEAGTGPGRTRQPAGPHARIVVVGSPGRRRGSRYRKHKLFYYAVEPFADNEIADILMGVFASGGSTRQDRTSQGPSEPISSISITNRNLHKVQLLAAPGLLWGNEGLGLQVGQKLLAQMFPVVVTPGETQLTPANILKAGRGIRSGHGTPGPRQRPLARRTGPRYETRLRRGTGRPASGPTAGKVAMLSVQPDKLGGFACLDARTIAALADHIVWDMASY